MEDDREEVVLRHMLVHRCVSECVLSERNRGANGNGRWHSTVPLLALNSSAEVCICVCTPACVKGNTVKKVIPREPE